MNKKKVIIFESVKGAGKTLLTVSLQDSLKDAIVYGEEITLKPIKHVENKETVINHYMKIINEIKNTNATHFLLDRFHFSKWPVVNYENNYFKEIEKSLLESFDVELIFLEITEDSILPRLMRTESHRKSTGWKLNDDGISIEYEAAKDIQWQDFFLKHQYKDTLIPRKLKIDTTDLPHNLGNLELYKKQILAFI